MAKPTGPFLSLGASGSVAKTIVASKWKGRPYIRQHVIPANPNTVAQQSTRNAFRVAGEIYKLAPTLFTAPWELFATGQVLTGRNAFTGRYIFDNRGAADLSAMVFSPGAKGGIVAAGIAAAATAGGTDVTLTAPSLPVGWTITAGIAAVIRDGDPDTTLLTQVTAAQDLVTPYVIQITGLTAAQLYRVGGWFQYAKPDLSVAYGPSLLASVTPT